MTYSMRKMKVQTDFKGSLTKINIPIIRPNKSKLEINFNNFMKNENESFIKKCPVMGKFEYQSDYINFWVY